MSLIFSAGVLLLIIVMIFVTLISIKKRTAVPAVLLILVILSGYLGLTAPYCHNSSNFFVEDDPELPSLRSDQRTVGNFLWSAPRWKVDGDQVTKCDALYEVLLLGAFGR